MLRFIGNNLDSSDFSRAAQWTGRIKELKEKGLQKFFLFIHEPDDIKAPEMAAHFLKQINEHLNLTIDFNLREPTMHLQPKLFT
ncbi:MAG: hypothetical protein H7061_04295 [Bdellovibrionaceae bacterium]|nr:hypothetical protein [Bdellovibrio sp.]